MTDTQLNPTQNITVNEILQRITSLHISEAIEILESLSKEKRSEIFVRLHNTWYQKNIEWFPEHLVQEVIDLKGINFVIDLIKEVRDKDFLYHVIKDLDEDEKDKVLDTLPIYNRKTLETKLNYPKDSAGRLMQSNYHVVLQSWTVSQCLHYLKEVEKYNKDNDYVLNDIYIIDDKGHAVGYLSLYKLLTAALSEPVINIQNDNFKTVTVDTDQEEVALLFKNRGFATAGVIDENNHLVGIITSDDVIDVIYKEAGEDFSLVSGVDSDILKHRGIFTSSISRVRWLSFNLISALTIPFIVSYFHEVLTEHVIIAALAQFVAALGGNAGMQSLSVTIRGLSLKLISIDNALPQIKKEFLIALVNGTLLGIFGLVWGAFWGNSLMISVIAFCAVWVNILIGVFFGTFFPIMLTKLKIDPAIASSICVTTSTDICGFFAVLLISSILLG